MWFICWNWILIDDDFQDSDEVEEGLFSSSLAQMKEIQDLRIDEIIKQRVWVEFGENM